MTDRSSLPETRNWLKTIPEIVVFIDLLSPAQRAALKNLLRALAKHGRAKSEDLWKKNKAPMAVYWRVKSVYARLFSYLIKDRPAAANDNLALKARLFDAIMANVAGDIVKEGNHLLRWKGPVMEVIPASDAYYMADVMVAARDAYRKAAEG